MNTPTAAKLVAFLALTLLMLAVSAQGQSGPDATLDGVLLLRNGEVIQGRIAQQGDRFHVQLADAEIRIRMREVELVCRSVEEGYQKKRAALRTPRARDHIALAEWCLRQQMFDHAERELAVASHLEPLHPELHRAHQRLEQARSPVTPGPSAVAAIHQANHELDRFVKGLPEKSVESYTRTIQPLLMNGCAAAACHGPQAKSSFTLVKAPSGKQISRRLTQRNLQQTMKLVRADAPLASPLLTVPLEPHGTCTTPLFRKEQHGTYWQLAEWISQISQANEAAKSAAVGNHGEPLLQTMQSHPNQPTRATAVEESSEATTTELPSFEVPDDFATPAEVARSVPPAEASSPRPVGRATRGASGYTPIDPFDPEVFNRRYGRQ